jgi:hypothetical protein
MHVVALVLSRETFLVAIQKLYVTTKMYIYTLMKETLKQSSIEIDCYLY